MKNNNFHKPEFQTINNMWINSANVFRNKKAFCVRNSKTVHLANNEVDEEVSYEPITYEEMESLIVTMGKGLIKIGLKEKEAVGLISENCLRWFISDQAILGNRSYNVPRGIGLTRSELVYILWHSEAKIVIVENENELNRILELRRKLPKLKSIIVLDEEFKETNTRKNIYSFNDIIELGKKASKEIENLFLARRNNTKPSDIATMMYTSGTTGTPKAIPLMHQNIMHNVEIIPFLLKVNSSDKFISILAIWHIFERTIEYMVIRLGASIWYTTRLTILKDLALIEPTFMVSVPRIWILVYNGVMKNIRHHGKEDIFNKFYNHSLNVMHAKRYKENRQYLLIDEKSIKKKASFIDYLFNKIGDLLIYSKVREKVGKNFIAGISGGGSLPEYIEDFFEVIGITLLEGYGLTETSPVLCVRTFNHHIPYTVGKPLPYTDIKILDEDGNEIKNSEKGVIWVKGPQVMNGYYKNPEETNKVIKKDKKGDIWFNTGDLGRRIKYGDITIIGRVKDTIVLINGENVEPTRIETTLMKSLYIDQVMVCGQDQEYLTALIVPDEEILQKECKKLGILFKKEQILNLIENEEIKKIYMNIVQNTICKSKGFEELEYIHNIAFVTPFSPESNTLTHTLKIRRHKVEVRDYKIIKEMYPNFNEGGKIKNW